MATSSAGRHIELVTGRVVLHALDDHGQPFCGHDKGQLTQTGQPWNDGYLPHLPRCHSCTAQVTGAPVPARPGTDDGPPRRAAQASDVDIRTAHGADRENAGSAALRAVLAEHDLRRWMFTDLITIDETIRGGVSHPLTISPALLVQRPARPGADHVPARAAALAGRTRHRQREAEARTRWPDPPPLSAGGATGPTSTWLHMSVCALEYHSLAELLGPFAAAAELRQHAGYSWIYRQILASPDRFSSFLHRHGLKVPEQPPVPRRYFGEPWWASDTRTAPTGDDVSQAGRPPRTPPASPPDSSTAGNEEIT